MAHADHVNILTFDIEDWFHIIGARGLDDPSVWPTLPGIVERETMGILSLLDRHAVRATFFVVGWVAERYPALIRRIAEAGHELASHSHLHRTVFSMTPAMFREDLRRSVYAIEQAADVRVLGYRAPSFSIVPGCEWALEIIAEQGLIYDASFFPVPRANGGYPCAQSPHKLTLVSGANLAEVPMTTMSLLGYRSAFSGAAISGCCLRN